MEVLKRSGDSFSLPGVVEYPHAEAPGSVKEDTCRFRFSKDVNAKIRVMFFSCAYGPGESFKIEDSLRRVTLNGFASKKQAFEDLEKLHGYIITQALEGCDCGERFLGVLRICFPEDKKFTDALAYKLVRARTEKGTPRPNVLRRAPSMDVEAFQSNSLELPTSQEGGAFGGESLQPMPVHLTRARSLPAVATATSKDARGPCTIL